MENRQTTNDRNLKWNKLRKSIMTRKGISVVCLLSLRLTIIYEVQEKMNL